MSTASLTLELSAGDEIATAVEGSWTGANVPTGTVYLEVRDPGGKLSAETKAITPPANFASALFTSPNLPAGTYTGRLEVRACTDAQCGAVIAGAVASVPYTLSVAAVTDWEMHQRDANHRGYIPITLNPAKFAYAWQWKRPASADPVGSINAVVTGNNQVFITTNVYFSEGTLYALSESTGDETWRRAFGSVPALNPPAVSNGRVYATVSGHDQTALWAFSATTGNFLFNAGFSGQWPHLMAPTVYKDQIYTGAGHFGGETYSFSAETKVRNWVHKSQGVWDMFGPAVDNNYVYHYNGLALFIIGRTSGLTVASISDPFGKIVSNSYQGTAVLGGRRNVIAFSGSASSGPTNSSAEQFDQRPLSSFNLDSLTHEWATGNAYLTAPAVAKGVIYAARNSPMSLDAIDETTGKVLWSWVPTAGTDTSFHRNIVVTSNLLFVSTDKAVYAVDLKTRAAVWSYPKPGMLAISADRTLFIATGATESDGGLIAIKLK